MSVPPEEARDLLRGLVATPSVSGDERECAERLVGFFEGHGREAWLDDVGNVRAPADDAVLLTSHVDTVPGEVPVREEDGVLWGRGSVDAKGPLAAMAAAAVGTGTSFAGVVGEEADSRGARHLVEERDPPDAVVNGEPSGWDAVTLGYRGSLSGTYRTETESSHTSLPENNAIQDAMEWWRRAEEAAGADEDGEQSDGERGERGDGEEASVFERVTAKPLRFAGGPSDDGHAVEATVDVQFRIPPGTTTNGVRGRVEAALRAGAVEWRDAIPPVMQSARTPVARAFRAAIREAGGDPRLLRKTGTSDMNIYAGAWDCPMVTYGPGDSSLDHTPNEHLPLEEFDRAVEVLELAAARL